MIVTTEMMYREIQQLKALLFELLGKDAVSVEKELTMNQAKKLLGLGAESIISEIKLGRLNASIKRKRITKAGETKLFTYYKFKRSDLIEYQKQKFSAKPQIEFEETEKFDAKDFVKKFHEKRKAS